MSAQSDFKAERLLELSEEVTRIAASLARLSRGITAPIQQPPGASAPNEVDVAKETLSWLIQARRERARYLPPEMFSEPAWDMLLELLAAELAHRRVTVSSLCEAPGVPTMTAARWLRYLEQKGLAVRQADGEDEREDLVALSRDASKALCDYLRDVVEAPAADRAAPRRALKR
jgi:DNA-binding MarR family transcriptional regulator